MSPAPIHFDRRRVGRTDLEVTTLGLGTATFGGMLGSTVPDETARATVGHALDAGIRFVDTAPHYGFGLAEHLVGDALRFRDGDVVLATKVGRLLRPVRSDADRTVDNPWTRPFPFEIAYDYSYSGIIRSFEDSLQRLGLAKIDVLFVHDIGTQTHGDKNAEYWAQLTGGGYRALTELKAKGLVSAIGLGVNEWPVLMDALGIGDWDLFLLANRYTLLEQTPLTPLFETCLKRGTSVVAAGPFSAGVLAGRDIFGPTNGAYQRTPPEVRARVAQLEAVCSKHGIPLPAAALQFGLAHPAVATVLTGPRSVEELDGILGWWTVKIPDAFWNDLADQKLLAPGTPLPNGRTV